MNSAQLLNEDDRCRRAPILGQKWERNCLNPSQILYRAVEYGLEVDSEDSGLSASDQAMQLCVDHTIDTPQSDLLGLARHLSAIAEYVVWLVRTESAWERPADLKLGKETWVSSSFLNGLGNRLRRVILVDKWSDQRAVAESHNWRSLEAAVYGLPMDLIVVCLGPNREGRRHGPLTRGYLHPIANNLRFIKRDGGDFGENWNKVWREDYQGTREDWLESMSEDGVLPDVVLTHEIPFPENYREIRALAESKIARIRETKELPEAQLSQCDNPLHPCEFRYECPKFILPSTQRGFACLDKGLSIVR